MSDGKATAFEIIELCEAGPDGGGLMGYYARGHHDFHRFVEGVNQYTGAHPEHDERYVALRSGLGGTVRHEWWRVVPDASDPGSSRFISAEPRSRGAFAVTVTTIVEDRERRRTERWIEEFRKGSRNGFSDGLNWALRQLDIINPEAGEEFLRRYREQDKAKL